MSRKLLPYQTDCLTKLSAARPNKKGLIVMASGLGKTFIAAHDVKNFLAQPPFAKAQPLSRL